MKMLPREYASAKGEAFRTEDYKGAKVEFFYLDDQTNYGKYVSRGRFAIWTSDGTNYRLFVDKGYYAAVADLYRNDVNEIWLDFTNVIYGEQQKMSRLYILISIIVLVVVIGGSMGLQELFKDQAQTIMLVSFVVLFAGLFGSSSYQQRKLRKLVETENANASANIRKTLGEEKFQTILQNQEAYYQAYFKTEDEVVEETQALPELEVEETEKQEEIDEEDGKNE